MALLEVHNKECEEKLGEAFPHVHRWLDAYAKVFPPQRHGTRHRHFRHNEEGIAFIREKYGEEAAKAARIHIDRDNGVNWDG